MKNCSKQDHHDVLAKRGIIEQGPMFFIPNSILGLGFKTGMMKAISSRNQRRSYSRFKSKFKKSNQVTK